MPPHEDLVDELLVRNTEYATRYPGSELPRKTATGIAIVACMDARFDPYAAFGLAEGDAHVIRNAGGAVTDDVIRSLMVSQRLVGTDQVVVVAHTDCGMRGVDEGAVIETVEAEVGARPPFALEGFTDLDTHVRESVARIEASAFVPSKRVRGFVFEVETGRLREVR